MDGPPRAGAATLHVWMGAGTGFCDDGAARAFFTVGRQYRARGFVATSYNKYTAQDFITRVRSHLGPFTLRYTAQDFHTRVRSRLIFTPAC
jgi:hypothetical protein